METQGTLSPAWLQLCQMVVVSPKSPGMGEKFEPEKLKKFLDNFEQRHREGRSKPAVALKIVLFSQQDIEFMLDVIEFVAHNTNAGIHPGLLFASVGNPYPPKLIDDKLTDSMQSGDIHKLDLLRAYRTLCEDIANDDRITHVKILPQLHVLAWGNEAER
ncbi:hypothetical protein [Parvimonas sp. M13]|uniref:hypothetical protein n=1 Tax=Parvimonas sp. M13 TaxID=3110694 RepID=UPI002B4A397D|nr:hypothetical protein [Parvimonas sp. M13]MEB3025805.1 hypothetical protein [Parvimonas sp. M13]